MSPLAMLSINSCHCAFNSSSRTAQRTARAAMRPSDAVSPLTPKTVYGPPSCRSEYAAFINKETHLVAAFGILLDITRRCQGDSDRNKECPLLSISSRCSTSTRSVTSHTVHSSCSASGSSASRGMIKRYSGRLLCLKTRNMIPFRLIGAPAPQRARRISRPSFQQQSCSRLRRHPRMYAHVYWTAIGHGTETSN